MRFKLYSLLLFILFTSCTKKNLVYFSDLHEPGFQTEIQNKSPSRIQSGDMLAITVSTLSQESNTLFNAGVLTVAGATANQSLNPGYLVDENGFINFPVIGKIKLTGLNKEEAGLKLTAEITKFVKNPIINLTITNFRISVIGEVNNPSNLSLPTDKINIFQAIAMAGDLTVNGKRDNIAIIREENNKRNVIRINLNKKEIFYSPYYYLKQNDIIYVEPDKAKAPANKGIESFRTILAISTSLITIAVLVLTSL